jgi:hypothetical protein
MDLSSRVKWYMVFYCNQLVFFNYIIAVWFYNFEGVIPLFGIRYLYLRWELQDYKVSFPKDERMWGESFGVKIKSKKKHVGFVSNKKKTSITLVQIICVFSQIQFSWRF